MKAKSFLLGLFVGLAVVLLFGFKSSRQHIRSMQRNIWRQQARHQADREAEKLLEQQVNAKIGISDFYYRFMELERQVKNINELPTIKRRLEVRERWFQQQERSLQR